MIFSVLPTTMMEMQSLERITIAISVLNLVTMTQNPNTLSSAQTMVQDGVTGVNGHHVVPLAVQMLVESKLENVWTHRELKSIGKLDIIAFLIGNLMKLLMMIAIG